MSPSVVIFYILAAFIIGTSLLAVTARKIFRSAVWLLFSLMGIAGIYFWMDMNFIAAVQIIVYVGGIVVLIIFSIFLTQQAGKEMPVPRLPRQVWSVLAAGLGAALVILLIRQYIFADSGAQAVNADVKTIGTQMLSTTSHGFVLPFEVVSMLLLAAMIGCIVIAMKPQQSTV
jgi:NADH-quinone oxidoreductase subunit J